MIKRGLCAVAAILGVSFSSSAQEMMDPLQPVSFTLRQASPREMVESRVALQGTPSFRTLNNAWYGSGPLTLFTERPFSFPSAFGWVEATPGNFLPTFAADVVPRTTSATSLAGDDDGKPADLLHQFDYVGGEVGVFYGRSTGKSQREVTQGYILGEVVNGNTHIMVGGSYGHSSGRAARPVGW